MAYDDLQTKQDFIEQLSLEGKIWKLEKDNYRGPKDIENWENAFIYGFEATEREFIRESKIVWKLKDPIGDSDCPRYGLAGNIAHLQYLMKDDRIPRDVIGIEPEIWNEILELDEVIAQSDQNSLDTIILNQHSPTGDGLHVDDFESPTPSHASSSAASQTSETPSCTATPDHILNALDKIVAFLTGRFYYTHTNVGAKYAAYIDDYDDNVRIMAGFYDKAVAFLPNELSKMFKSGIIESWRMVIKELEDFFECDESRETMIDLFADLTSIAMNTGPTQSPLYVTQAKLTEMRMRIEKYFITDPKDFITCKESYHRFTRQTKCEEYSPIVNTLLTCILYMASPLPQTKWRQMHDNCFAVLRTPPSYTKWHQNRFQFYNVINGEIKEGNGVDPNLIDKCKRSNDVRRDTHSNIGAKNKKLDNSSRCDENQNLIAQFRANSENLLPNKIYTYNPRIWSYGENSTPFKTSRCYNNYTLDEIPKCSHCTRLLGKSVRHTGPYQGRGDKCLFDTKGIRKASICVRSERNGEIKDIPGESKRMATEAVGGRLEYTDTRNCVYIHSIIDESSDFRKQGYGASTGRAQNKSRQYFNKKVEKKPYRAKERCFEKAMHDKNHISYMKNVSLDVTSPDVTLKIQEDEIIDRKSKNEINEKVHRDENSNLLGINLVNTDPDNVFTTNESHRDDKIPVKSKYINWRPNLCFKFLNPNTPSHLRFGVALVDTGACQSVIHFSKLPFCRILKRERRQIKAAIGATGNVIPLADYTVDIAMEIDILGVFIMKKVLVSTSLNRMSQFQFILGVSDINRLKIGMDFKRKRVQLGVGPSRGRWIKMQKPCMQFMPHKNTIYMQHT